MLLKKAKEPSEQPGQPLPPPPPPPPVQSQVPDRRPSPHPEPELRVAKPVLPPPPQVLTQPQPAVPPSQSPVLTQPQPAVPPSQPQVLTQPQAVEPVQPLLPPTPLIAPNDVPPVAERKIREYRYRTRIIKAAILPIFFSIMSFWMLYNYVNGFEPFFSYEINIILAGFLIGFIVIAGFVLANMRRAKKDGSYAARQKYGVVIILAFLVPYAYYLLFKDPAEAWKFSIGYFASAIITPFVVMAYEALSDGKFYVQEEEVNDRLTRTLVFRH